MRFEAARLKAYERLKVHFLPPSGRAARFGSSAQTPATCKARAAENEAGLATAPAEASELQIQLHL